MEEKTENQKYLSEDNDLLDELDSIGPLSTGQALEEQKRRVQIVQIKTLLRSRKSAKDTEISNNHYSAVILLLTGIQVIVALPGLLSPWLGNSVKYFSIFVAILILTLMWFFSKKILN